MVRKYGIPADHIFNSRDKLFGAATLAVTKGRGVDVVLNSLAGSLLQESLNLVALFGHLIEIGKRGLKENRNLETRLLTLSIFFSAVDLPSLLEYRGNNVHRCLGEVIRLIKVKAVTPIYSIIAYTMGDIIEVSRLLQTGRHMGKVVLSVGPHEIISVLSRTAITKLSPNVSYLIVSANNGLGHSIAHWMVSRGTRNLVLLSRSAVKSEKIAALIEKLREVGYCRVLSISYDVASENDLV